MPNRANDSSRPHDEPLSRTKFLSQNEAEITDFIRQMYADSGLEFGSIRDQARFSALTHDTSVIGADRVRTSIDYHGSSSEGLEDFLFFAVHRGTVGVHGRSTVSTSFAGDVAFYPLGVPIDFSMHDFDVTTLRLPGRRLQQVLERPPAQTQHGELGDPADRESAPRRLVAVCRHRFGRLRPPQGCRWAAPAAGGRGSRAHQHPPSHGRRGPIHRLRRRRTHRTPTGRKAFAAGEETDLEPCIQEVRRVYPFFPAVPGRVCTLFEWHGHRFDVDDRVSLDLYGTCHDPGL